MILSSSGTEPAHPLLRLIAELPATLTVKQAADVVGMDETAVYRATQARRDGDIDAWPTEVLRIGKRRILIPTIPLLEAVGDHHDHGVARRAPRPG
ncbi:MAG: hypothetical protein IPG97_15085 [Microthrixaceae bacterium]|nr:hypothetical protein [Microthrixaceae bacterium]